MGDNAFAELTKLAKAENVPAASVTRSVISRAPIFDLISKEFV
ncbi:hypothetical protein [Achromobacter insolitus]|nr:hypothetical protein [Achromobacter insolitus]